MTVALRQIVISDSGAELGKEWQEMFIRSKPGEYRGRFFFCLSFFVLSAIQPGTEQT